MFVITGGGSGIGRALAMALAKRGKPIFIIGRHQESLLETAQTSPLISTCCADLSTEDGLNIVTTALKDIPQLEGLIHNAGTVEPIAPIQTIAPKAWQQTIAVNLNAPLFLSQQLLHKLAGGRVLHMGSAVAYFPVSGWAAYCVSKAGLAMLVRCWQLECQTTAFASVMPGISNTPMQELIRNAPNMKSEDIAFYQRLYRENQLVSPETVAAFLTWLLLDVDVQTYCSQEWDIYDKSHHQQWLFPPHCVPEWKA